MHCNNRPPVMLLAHGGGRPTTGNGGSCTHHSVRHRVQAARPPGARSVLRKVRIVVAQRRTHSLRAHRNINDSHRRPASTTPAVCALFYQRSYFFVCIFFCSAVHIYCRFHTRSHTRSRLAPAPHSIPIPLSLPHPLSTCPGPTPGPEPTLDPHPETQPLPPCPTASRTSKARAGWQLL